MDKNAWLLKERKLNTEWWVTDLAFSQIVAKLSLTSSSSRILSRKQEGRTAGTGSVQAFISGGGNGISL